MMCKRGRASVLLYSTPVEGAGYIGLIFFLVTADNAVVVTVKVGD